MDFIRVCFSFWIKFLLTLWIFIPSQTLASWMYLGVASLAGARTPTAPENTNTNTNTNTCNNVPGLVVQQLQVCQRNPESLLCIKQGARLGIYECQSQFKYERWNCTTSKNYTVFGEVLRKGTKETAFIYAILSAGVVHAVTQSCSAGNLTDCTCDMSRYGEHSVDGWKWGGCSDNVKYGVTFSKTFVDAPETLKHQSSLNIRNKMNLHNNEVGRRVVENLMALRCRCHGVSGSCAVQTCWKSLPSFRTVGNALKAKYEQSVRVARRSRRKLRRREKNGKRRTPVSSDDMVFVHRSPNYCKPNPKKGILGTNNRLCNKTSLGAEGCDLLCCGRGYNTQVVRYTDRCHCKFVWCCFVECKTCETVIDRHTCK